MKRLCALAAAMVTLLLVTGCNTPARRIKDNPALFASFPAAAQAAIRQGQVMPGFTKPMVEMALGKPDHYFRKTTADGSLDLWTYVGIQPPPNVTHEQEFDVVYRGKDRSQYRVVPLPNFPLATNCNREYDRIRVEFAPDGTVAGVETLLEK